MKILANQLNTPINSAKSVFVVEKQSKAEGVNAQSFGNNIKIKTVGHYTETAFNWLGKRNTPFNRFLIGAFAFATQPWIDLYNKDVDKETRKASFQRTMAKIIVGTTTGILARMGCIRLMDEFTDINKGAKGYRRALIPTNVDFNEFTKAKRLIKNHRDALGSFIAIGVMMITDPPLTVAMTNFFNKKREKIKNQTPTNEKGGN